MADFRPETTVQLYRATGVDERNQPYFESEGAKLGWYQSHRTFTFNAYSYQRENRQYIRVQGKAETLRDYDMLSFQNSEGRHVFCRVLEVEFVNPNCVDISYEVDYMQTYIDVVTFGECWVEREMVVGDWDGSKPSFNNLQPEGIETGKLRRISVSGDSSPLVLYRGPQSGEALEILVLSAYDESAQPLVSTKTIGGLPSGLNAISFSWPIDRGALSSMLETYSVEGRTDGIACIAVGPVGWMDNVNGVKKSATFFPTWNRIDGYTLVNAKCYTSEFCNFELDNGLGNSVELRPEMFTETDNIIIDVEGGFSGGGGGAIAHPRSYETNPFNAGVVIPFDIQVPYVTSGFMNWLANNKNGIIAGLGSNLTRAALAGAAIGTGGSTAAFSAVASAFAQIADKAADPLAIGGQAAGNGLNYTVGNVKFTFSLVCPSVPNLKSIDEYFGRFGYRTNRFKVPNVNTRPKWNYVKTAGAICRGPFPKKAQDYMQRLCDNGVTFWHLAGGENITADWTIEQNKE